MVETHLSSPPRPAPGTPRTTPTSSRSTTSFAPSPRWYAVTYQRGELRSRGRQEAEKYREHVPQEQRITVDPTHPGSPLSN